MVRALANTFAGLELAHMEPSIAWIKLAQQHHTKAAAAAVRVTGLAGAANSGGAQFLAYLAGPLTEVASSTAMLMPAVSVSAAPKGAACTAQWLTAQTGMPAGAMQHFVVGAGWVSLTVPPPSADHDIVLKVVCV